MMEVFENINILKGTKATKKQINNWSLMNKICPIEFETELDLNCEYPKELKEIADKYCDGKCDQSCLDKFLSHQITLV